MTKVITIDQVDLRKIKILLDNSGLIAFPTETVYSLSCNALDDKSISKIYKIKERDIMKPLSLLISNKKIINKIAYLSDIAIDLINKYMPGPLTIILKSKDNKLISPKINNFGSNIGVRIPNHEFSLKLLNYYGGVLVGTSVNISSEKAMTNANEIREAFNNKIDLIIDGGDSPLGIGSTIVDLTNDIPVVVRQGSLILNL